jgi:hypothetical protein
VAFKNDLDATSRQVSGTGGFRCAAPCTVLSSDLFGTYLIRIDLRRLPSAIPTGNQGHAQYWADNWKIQFDSDAQKQALIATFKGEADTADSLLP